MELGVLSDGLFSSHLSGTRFSSVSEARRTVYKGVKQSEVPSWKGSSGLQCSTGPLELCQGKERDSLDGGLSP